MKEIIKKISPDEKYITICNFGVSHTSVVSSGYGQPWHKVDIKVLGNKGVDYFYYRDKPLIKLEIEAEEIQIEYSDDSDFIEVTHEIAGTIYNSSSTRYWRKVFHIKSGLEFIHDSTVDGRSKLTESCPSSCKGTVSYKINKKLESLLNTSLAENKELLIFLKLINKSGVDVATSEDLLRTIFSILLTNSSYWDTNEVEIRLEIAKILKRASLEGSKNILRKIIPFGQLNELKRNEYNSIMREIINKYIKKPSLLPKKKWWHFF